MKITHKKIQASTQIKASYDVVLKDGDIYRVDDPDKDRYEIVEVHNKPYIKKANSIEEASKMIRNYIEDYNLGGSEYTGGLVLENDKPVYYISYNGKATPFDEFIKRWGTGIIHNSRVLKSLGITPEQYGYDPNVLHSSTDVEASKELPENQWTEEYDEEVGDYFWVYNNENGTAIIRPDGKDYKTPGDVGYDLLVKYAFNGDRPKIMRKHYEGGGALDSAMLSGEMRLFNFNPVESCDQITASSDWVEGFTEGVGNHFDLEREAGTAQIYEMEADGDIGYGVLVKYNGKKKRDVDSFWGPNALNDAKEFAEYCLKDEIESCDNVTAATSTWDRISGLEEQIAQLEASIEDAKASGADIEDLLSEYEELDRLKDELRFAWADDEQEWLTALQEQEFDPDGRLRGYHDPETGGPMPYVDLNGATDTMGLVKVHHNNPLEHFLYGLAQEDIENETIIDNPDTLEIVLLSAGFEEGEFDKDKVYEIYRALIYPNENLILSTSDVTSDKDVPMSHFTIYNKYSGNTWGKFNTYEEAKAAFDEEGCKEYECSIVETDWDGENVYSSTDIEAADIIRNKKIQKGLVWHSDGFTKEVISVSKDHKTCKVQETWINEDTGKPMKKVFVNKIALDEKYGEEYAYDPDYEEYAKPGSDSDEDYSWWARKYASGASNYPWKEDDEEEESQPDSEPDEYYDEDYYTPSATAGDYSPSSPWDAPGMSVKDFI